MSVSKNFPKNKKYHSPAGLVCDVKGHEWSFPRKDHWMDYHGDKNFYYHKCYRCDVEVKHLDIDCPSCPDTGNTFVGYQAGATISTGKDNIFIGPSQYLAL